MKKIALNIAVCLLVILFVFIGFFSGKFVSITYPVYKTIRENNIQSKIKDYKHTSTEHFIIKYQDDDAECVDMVKYVAEKSYEEVGADFNYFPSGKMTIIIYSSNAEMNNNLALAKGSNAMGVYYNGVIGILAPALWLGDNQNVEQKFEKDGPILHEYTHLLVDDIAKGNYPIWLTEGIALNEEYRINGYVWCPELSTYEKYSIKTLTDNFTVLDENSAYKRSFEIVNYISKNYGINKIVDMLKLLGGGYSLDKALNSATGLSMDKLDELSKTN